MLVVFVSNFYNHHQSSFAHEMFNNTDKQFYFISCEQISSERKSMGWGDTEPPFVLHYEDEIDICRNLIDSADVVILGSAPYGLLKCRLKHRKLTFIYSERLDKVREDPLRFAKHFVQYIYKYKRFKSLYCLCSSAFTAYDFSKRYCFKNKTYKWGYFPPFEKVEDINELFDKKCSNEIRLLYVSRFIPLKHPELPVKVLEKLINEGIVCHLTMIGIGELQDEIRQSISEKQLGDYVSILNSMTPSQVREYMNISDIFMFTSDRNEGWGAVINESMNSGCAVVASSAIGSVPFLIENDVNGCIYRDGDFEDLYKKVKELCISNDFRRTIGVNAYYTIEELWNAKTASKRLLELIDDLNKYGGSDRFMSGPCSRAEIIKDRWYR